MVDIAYILIAITVESFIMRIAAIIIVEFFYLCAHAVFGYSLSIFFLWQSWFDFYRELQTITAKI